MHIHIDPPEQRLTCTTLPQPPLSDLSHNRIASTAGLYGRLTQLRTLILAGNCITDVDGLVGLPALVDLEVSGCRISSAQRLRGLSLNPSLRILRLQGRSVGVSMCP